MPIHTISFSVPAENIVDHVPEKEKMVADCQYNSRAFLVEEDYFAEYKRSLFGNTKKKAGWDCLRHYEILANGCIPYFENIDDIPPKTMADFPRDIVKRGMMLKDLNRDEYVPIIEELLDYTRKNLTTEARARYILRILGKRPDDIKSVLFLGGSNFPDYLRCNVLHGFKMLYGEKCVDYVRIPHMYDSYPSSIRNDLFSHGFTYAFRVPAIHDIMCDRSNIEDRIRKHEFDIVVYGSIHRGMPFLETVLQHYKHDELAFMCGEDIGTCNFSHDGLASLYHLFVREQ